MVPRAKQKKDNLDTLTSYTKKISRVLWGLGKFLAMAWISSLLVKFFTD